MILVDEQHDVTIVTIDGVSIQVGTARLNEDDTVDGLREQVIDRGGGSFREGAANDLGDAFDIAFAQCESLPGSEVTAEASFGLGTVFVKRRLAA